VRTISIALGFIIVLVSAPAQADQVGKTCREAIYKKHPCTGTRPDSPVRGICFKAAMQRCRNGGVGAI
jgi:hypothetical protein